MTKKQRARARAMGEQWAMDRLRDDSTGKYGAFDIKWPLAALAGVPLPLREEMADVVSHSARRKWLALVAERKAAS